MTIIDRPGRQMAESLYDLWHHLAAHQGYGTLYRYTYQPQTPGLVNMMAQYRRSNRANRVDAEIALDEFHAALFYLSWNQPTDAYNHLLEAQQYWQYVHDQANLCLVEFALGKARHLGFHFHEAQAHYRQSGRRFERLWTRFQRGQLEDLTQVEPFLKAFRDALYTTMEALEGDIREMLQSPALLSSEDVTNTEWLDDIEIASPIINNPELNPRSSSMLEIPVALPLTGRPTWYEVVSRYDNFLSFLKLGDQILVDQLPGRESYLPNELVVVDSSIQGTVRVRLDNQLGDAATLSIARIVKQDAPGRIRYYQNGKFTAETADNQVVIGIVVGSWRQFQQAFTQ
ncbi:MAG: hypothetical protein KDE09_21655 [Anaerolineales bacterium]|nr:hypothetical protein [Anaerolineales bacterium]MCB0006660.1 hypothetical protein [Anaerolineales bacterium]MCB0011884.1 hypothetical protein [Anaerolineales bacterium]MCB0020419.1 hypothetical protein [Anaerolineales bacterium]MCB8962081.1 hypothetical protein [Ardenticatenales bacterium]